MGQSPHDQAPLGGAAQPAQDDAAWSKLISLTAYEALRQIPAQGQIKVVEHGLDDSVPKAPESDTSPEGDQLFLRLEDQIYGPVTADDTLRLISSAKLSGYEAVTADLHHWSPLAYHPRFVPAHHGDLLQVHAALDELSGTPVFALAETAPSSQAPPEKELYDREFVEIFAFPSEFTSYRRASSVERFGAESQEEPNPDTVPSANPERSLTSPGRHTAVIVSPFAGAGGMIAGQSLGSEEPTSTLGEAFEQPTDAAADEAPAMIDTASLDGGQHPDAAPGDDFSEFFSGDDEAAQPAAAAQTEAPIAAAPRVKPAAPSRHQPAQIDIDEGTPKMVWYLLGAAFVGAALIVGILLLTS